METRGSPELQLQIVRDYQARLRAEARIVATASARPASARPRSRVWLVRVRLGRALVAAGVAIAGAGVTSASSVARY